MRWVGEGRDEAAGQGGPHPCRRVRVAYCLDSFNVGGTELNAVRTAEALDPSRVELKVFHLHAEGPLRQRYERLGIEMVHLPIRNLYSPATAMQGLRFARELRGWKADVVHSHDIYCNIFMAPWSRIGGRNAFIASRRWWYDAPRPGLVPLNRWCSVFADRVLANSSGVAQLLVREENVPPAKVVEVPNFLDDRAFESVPEGRREAQRRAWGVADGAFLVGIVARLSKVKNHRYLVQALAALDRRFHLAVIGDGPLRGELEAMARSAGLAARVTFTGELVSAVNVHQFFDASVLCSTSEGFPNSVIEGMAAGTPVVATAVGGVTDVVTDGDTGLLVPLDDVAAFASALRRLDSDRALSGAIGEAGRLRVMSRYRKEIVIEKLTRLYESLAPVSSSVRPQAIRRDA